MVWQADLAFLGVCCGFCWFMRLGYILQIFFNSIYTRCVHVVRSSLLHCRDNVSAGNVYSQWCLLSIWEPERTRWAEMECESIFKGVETRGRNMSLWAHLVPVPKGVITDRLWSCLRTSSIIGFYNHGSSCARFAYWGSGHKTGYNTHLLNWADT